MNGPLTAARFARVLVPCALVATVLVAASATVGATDVDVLGVLLGGGSAAETSIVHDIRLPRAVLAALCGGILAVAGVALQALLRNPLAEPYLLGISGGGAFGAVLTIVLAPAALGWLPARAVGAFLGALAALAVVYRVATWRGSLRPVTLLLAGVVVNAFFLAALAAVQFAATPEQAQSILRWVMGGLVTPSGAELWLVGATAVPALLLVLREARSLDALSRGEETARALGVDVVHTRRRVFVVAALATACCVAVAGPIGFVGLVVPHATRLFAGTGHRLVVPVAFCVGAAFLALADALARVVLAPQELPVGIVTAVAGAPLFVVLLLRASRRGGVAVV